MATQQVNKARAANRLFLQEQQDSLLREFLKRQLWRIFMSEDDLSSLDLGPIFKQVAHDLIVIEKRRPDYIPLKFYKWIIWSMHIAKEHIENLDLTLSFNVSIKNGTMNRISYFENLISKDVLLKEFFVKNKDRNELFMAISDVFRKASEWPYEFKTTGKKDAQVAIGLRDCFIECEGLLLESPDIRFNLQMEWERQLEKVIGKPPNKEQYIDLLRILGTLAECLNAIEPIARQKKSHVKKMNAKDAVVHFTARSLKDVLQLHGVDDRKYVRYITNLINAVMGENVTEYGIRKLIK